MLFDVSDKHRINNISLWKYSTLYLLDDCLQPLFLVKFVQVCHLDEQFVDIFLFPHTLQLFDERMVCIRAKVGCILSMEDGGVNLANWRMIVSIYYDS